MNPSKLLNPKQIDAAIARTEWVGRLTAAREAVVEAAKEWVKAKPGVENARGLTGIWEAVAHLLEVEKEHG